MGPHKSVCIAFLYHNNKRNINSQDTLGDNYGAASGKLCNRSRAGKSGSLISSALCASMHHYARFNLAHGRVTFTMPGSVVAGGCRIDSGGELRLLSSPPAPAWAVAA